MSRSVNAIVADLQQRDLLEPLETIARAHHVTPGELLGRSRYPHVVRARDAFLGHLVAVCGWSLACSGRLLGLDHSTVIAAMRRMPQGFDDTGPPSRMWKSSELPVGNTRTSPEHPEDKPGESPSFDALAQSRARPGILKSVFSSSLNLKKEKAGDTGTSKVDRAREFASNPVSEMRLRGAVQDPPGSASILDSLESKRGSAS